MTNKNAMITIAGRPNVGKSTLTNALVGEKVAIVSNKPQTTRSRVTGIVTRGDTQFVFMDTPELHRARTRLGDYMVNVVKKSVADVNADPVQCGLSGSPTKVKKIENVVFQAKESKRLTDDDTELEDLIKELIANHTIG